MFYSLLVLLFFFFFFFSSRRRHTRWPRDWSSDVCSSDLTKQYDLGEGYGHIAIEVDDAYAACDKIKAKGGKVVREAGPMKHGTTVIAFVKDPDGYKIELIQAKGRVD